MKILDKINSPKDLDGLSLDELKMLAEEIRKFIINNVHKTGGHLAASLGVVELTIALHKVFETPSDKIIWDVGHQAYAHKILTGRKDRFHTNRQYGGISGFTKPSESEHDAFGVGHASTSISAGFGFVCGREMKGEEYNVISIIGDGAITGGLAYEGLNNAGASKKKFLVVLNDNEMSISQPVGAMSKYFTSVLTDPKFNKLKDELWDMTGKYKIGEPIRKGLSRLEKSVKTLLTPGIFFEKMGFNYVGPIDGHDIENLVKVLENIKNDVSGPVFLHVLTEKGKGFKPAELDKSGKYHGVGPGILQEDVEEKTVDDKKDKKIKYQDVFGRSLCQLAEKDSRLIAITAAMKSGTGLDGFAEKFPDRFYDVGIAEEHAVTFAAALSLSGFKPVVAIYSTFLQRSLDQIIHDCALQNLDMIFALDRAGIVGDDGPTHHGVFDLSYLRYIPGLTIMAPADEKELKDMLYTASNKKGLFVIRYPRGTGPGISFAGAADNIEIGVGRKLKAGENIAILAVGKMVENSLKAAEILNNKGISVSVYDMRFVRPIDENLLREAYDNHDHLITVEENSVIGGFGSGVLEEFNKMEIYDAKVKILGIPDHFVEQGDVNTLFEKIGLDPKGIADAVIQFSK